jgi:hypothetical protein
MDNKRTQIIVFRSSMCRFLGFEPGVWGLSLGDIKTYQELLYIAYQKPIYVTNMVAQYNSLTLQAFF